jgi:SWI/SNF-related matrix-associated actin-dependent regulator 1 of chromatin subfamily A
MQGKQTWWLLEWVLHNWDTIPHEQVVPIMPTGTARRSRTASPTTAPPKRIEPPPTQVIKGLYPFQQEGVMFIEEHNGRVLLADDMGLGKTIQAAAWLKWKNPYPALVVCPASVKYNWQKELRRWTGRDSVVLSGKTPKGAPPLAWVKLAIINYDILNSWQDKLRAHPPRTLILDEAHYIKNRGAKRTKAARQLGRRCKHVLALTGTPIESRPREIFTIANLVKPGLFPYYQPFAKEYCDRKFTPYGWDDSGVSNPEKLHQVLASNIMIRRMKRDVLEDLPEKTRTVLPVEIVNHREYQSARANLTAWLKEHHPDRNVHKQAEALSKIEYLKQITTKGKMSLAIEWIEDFLEDSDGKLVVFATHRFVIETLCQHWPEASRVEGGVGAKERQEQVQRFTKERKVRLFIGNLKAAGVGLNLQAASTALFLELGWTPAQHSQAEDRLHRIGQRRNVAIYYLIGKNTVEEQIMHLLDSKTKVTGDILDGGKNVLPPLWDLLLKSLKKEIIL